MRVADSSFLIVLSDRSDARRPAALRLAEDPAPIDVPREVISETLGVVHRRKGFEVARTMLAELVTIPHLRIAAPVDVAKIATVFEGEQGRLSWVDATVVVHCRESDAVPLCYDPAIEKAARR